MKHGASAYRSGACRCEICTEDHRVRHAQESAARRGAPDTPHGTWTAYANWGCRCDQCVEAYRLSNARRRAMKTGRVTTELRVAAMAIDPSTSPYHHRITGRDGRDSA